MPPPTVLVVEDDPVILRLLEVNFEPLNLVDRVNALIAG